MYKTATKWIEFSSVYGQFGGQSRFSAASLTAKEVGISAHVQYRSLNEELSAINKCIASAEKLNELLGITCCQCQKAAFRGSEINMDMR